MAMAEHEKRRKPREPEKKPGLRYETCVSCGLEWNVSRYAKMGWYICPHCEYRDRKKETRREKA